MQLDVIRKKLTVSVKNARKERRFTQKEVANWLDITQARYSQIENGNGSFTAEQLVVLMKKFNVPLGNLIGEKKPASSQLQNALLRFGAGELYEEQDILPSEKLAEIEKVITETLVSAESSRQITALAPVIVKNASLINLDRTRSALEKLGLLGRLGWLLDNVSHAIEQVLESEFSKHKNILYRKALVRINSSISFIWFSWSTFCEKLPEDILDKTISSQKSLEKIKDSRDSLAKNWKVITRITTEDFIKTLKESNLD